MKIIVVWRDVFRKFSLPLLMCCTLSANAQENHLKDQHETALREYQREEAAATDNSNKASALRGEAAELDSLNRTADALSTINRALGMIDSNARKPFVATKAGILFNMNQPQAAVEILASEIEATRKNANSVSSTQRAGILGTFTEGFITATFSYMQLEQWGDAIMTLVDAESPAEGPSFYAYKALVYRYIIARAKNPALVNPILDEMANFYAKHDAGHYGALLRMWSGEDADKEISMIIDKMDGAEQQDALAESLFYRAAHQKFVKGNSQEALTMLNDMNTLAPYGSIEWIYGRRVLK